MSFPELFADDVFHIETARLWLRWPRAADARALQQIAGIAAIAEMTATWPHPLPENEADWRILRAREANAAGTALVLAITRKKSPDQLIGTLGVRQLPVSDGGNGALGLGYMLAEAHHGRGLMTEAVIGLAGAVFTSTGYRLIRASSLSVNPASRRVLEKSGFEHTGTSMLDAPARGGMVEVDDFELSHSVWLGRMTRTRGQRESGSRAPTRAGSHATSDGATDAAAA